MKSYAIALLLIASAEAKRLSAEPTTASTGIYDTVAAGWSGQQIPGRKFERPDTGLDDETVLAKKRRGEGFHYPHLVEQKAEPITADSSLYDSVASGWSGQQIPGRNFERPDTGLDDDTVLRQKAKSEIMSMREAKELFADEGY